MSSDRLAGSISAILKADDSQLIAALEASGVKIDELKAKNPKITINTNSKEVLAQLTAVSAAAKKLGDSSQSVEVLQKKLDDLRASGAATEAEMKKIETVSGQLEKALRSQGSAAVGLESAMSKLGGGGSGGGGVGGGVLGGVAGGAESAGLSLSSALLPALVGVAAVLAGPLLAVGGGALATLALGAKGLEGEVVSGLAPAFQKLEASATSALGPGIRDALQQVEEALPQLTPLVNVFGKEIGHVAAQFGSWLNNGGLADFVTFADAELPQVESLFVSMTKVGVDFFQDVLPLANGLITTMTDVFNAVDKVNHALGKASDFGSGSTQSAATKSGTPLHDQGFIWHGSGSTGNQLAQTWHDITLPFDQPANLQVRNPKAPPKPADPFNNSNVQSTQAITAADLAAAKAADTQFISVDQLAGEMAELGIKTDGATLSTNAQAHALQACTTAWASLNDMVTASYNSELSAKDAIAQVTDSVKTNGTSLNDNTAKGRANTEAVMSALAAAKAHAEAVYSQTHNVQDATDALSGDESQLAATAKAAGLNAGQVDLLVKAYGGIPTDIETQIILDDTKAFAALDSIQAKIAYVVGLASTNGPAAAALSSLVLGSTGRGDAGYATGGLVGGIVSGPGSGTSDSIPARLSNGEFVINASATAANRQLLEAINSGQTPSAGPGSGIQINVNPSAGMDERAVGIAAGRYLQVAMA